MLVDEINFIQEIIEKYNINLVNLIFIGFTTIIVLFGSLISLVEPQLPSSIRQSFRYGKHSYKGANNKFVSRLEVPKEWFKHFYVFAFTWASLALFLVLKGFLTRETAPEPVLAFLDFVAGGSSNRRVQIDSTNAFVASILMTMQCGRRFYETNFVQIFSKKSKINLSHYMVGYIHYFGAIIALLANTEGFVRGSTATPFHISKLSLVQYISIFIFHMAWNQQYKANMILVNLRKDSKTGKVATEAHLIPHGGFFDYVSSPHMLFEIVMYVALKGLLLQSTTWSLVVIWVVSNQLVNALLTHRWYKENFSDYPKARHALMPFIL